ncbi:PH domain-containing protein [Nocardioides sp. SYSU D00038]|uniref:PH domain-containing protein n=1 Tax=Nocardioides sp. SYSU D00038 TaxID=2812554 RepID=UPI00196845AC|nr:PH domain-containing protein [Nocardioides sp. SYSU D00038]
MSTPAPPPAAGPVGTPWQRLDPRMLLVHPIRELVRFLPVLLGLLVAGGMSGSGSWHLVGVALPVGLGVLRWLTTSYRIHAGRVELRRGLLNRHVVSAPLERVRTVDLTSSPIHRLLGLTTLRVGTGTASERDEEKLDLDGLPVGHARELRGVLLRAGAATPAAPGADRPADVVPVAEGPDVLGFDPWWARYAPLTGSGVVIGAAGLGVLAQGLQVLDVWRSLDPREVADAVPGLPFAVLVPLVAVVLLVLVAVLAVVGYLVANWGFRLSHVTPPDGRGAWHVRRGLFTTRETSLDDERVAGVALSEPLLLRPARAARLRAVVTGLGGTDSDVLAPSAPAEVVDRVAARVLGTRGPLTARLTAHGPAATRRRWTRALGGAAGLAALPVVAVALGAAPAWLAGLVVLPVAAGLAADRARSLGHALVDGHLVARSGSLDRRRTVLDTEHVIGWNLRATWWQRRVGLTTLVATTAGGPQRVTVLDVPEDVAESVAAQALPDLVEQFRLV